MGLATANNGAFCHGHGLSSFFASHSRAGGHARWTTASPRLLHQGGALGVSFHVANQGQEMTVGLDQQRLIAALVDVP